MSVLWEVRDSEGYLITTCFSEKQARLYRERCERKGLIGYRLRKVFEAEKKDREPIRKWKIISRISGENQCKTGMVVPKHRLGADIIDNLHDRTNDSIHKNNNPPGS